MSRPNPAFRCVRGALIALVSALSVSSCGLFSNHTQEQTRSEQLSRMQFEVMRLSDQVILDLGSASRRYSRDVGTPDARRQSLTWSVSHTNRVLSIASNPKPLNALVDLYLFVSVQRIFHEEYWSTPDSLGEADRPMLDSFQRLETACWRTLSTLLDEKQQQALRDAITAWREQNPDLRSAAAVEAPSFADVVTRTKNGDRVPLVSDLVDLLSLDPLSGLEPAVREVATTRQLGERFFFYSQHMPRLMMQEAELLTLRTASLPEVQSTLDDTQRFSLAAAQISAAAAALPETLRSEREEALCQISDELTNQRVGLVQDLERAQGTVESLLAQSRETLDAGTRASDSIANGITALNAFVSRSSASDGSAPSDSAPSKPFDVTEYGAAAARIGDAAHELTAAITAADQHLPGVQRSVGEAAQRLDQSVDHAYGLALRLLFWAIGLVTFVVLAVRVVWRKLPLRRDSGGSSLAAGTNGSHPRLRSQVEHPRANQPLVEIDE